MHSRNIRRSSTLVWRFCHRQRVHNIVDIEAACNSKRLFQWQGLRQNLLLILEIVYSGQDALFFESLRRERQHAPRAAARNKSPAACEAFIVQSRSCMYVHFSLGGIDDDLLAAVSGGLDPAFTSINIPHHQQSSKIPNVCGRSSSPELLCDVYEKLIYD